MHSIRYARDRGLTRLPWLESYHSFSFADYYDPKFMGFRSLRVINDDIVAAGRGFEMHGHRDMEIISIVLEGAIQHRDSLGSSAILRPGEVQVMSAGRGIMHSEHNPSKTEDLHLLQIWIQPKRLDLPPSYRQEAFPLEGQLNRWQRVVAPESAGKRSDGAIPIAQDAELHLSTLQANHSLSFHPEPEMGLWLHVASGAVVFEKHVLQAGDAVAIEDGSPLLLTGSAEKSQLLLFKLAEGNS